MVPAALMCGIAGFVDLDGGNAVDAEAVARAMAATLRARGPDDAGAWSDGHVALGFRRLAIVDLSPLGHQPMASASRRFTIVFNGEIYNHGELRAELAAAGARFRGRSDTEVILAAIEAWGFEATLPRLRGMFAIAVWDARARTLSLARDRFGEKPLYVGWLRGGRVLAFASELKALRAHPAFTPTIDRAALIAFVRYGYVPGPRSIYQGVSKLAAGTWQRIAADGTVSGPPGDRRRRGCRSGRGAADPRGARADAGRRAAGRVLVGGHRLVADRDADAAAGVDAGQDLRDRLR